ncbi:unnamed protein product [Ectocarpus fasciculatus]
MAPTLSKQEKDFVDTLSAADRTALNAMNPGRQKTIVKKMMDSKERLASKSAASPSSSVFAQIPSFEIQGDADCCILCNGPSRAFIQAPWSFMCPTPCNLFVAQTAKEGERPQKAPLPCESCNQDMAPRTAYWPRDDDSGARKYNHVNASECVPTSAAKGECGACHAKDVDRCSINDSGQDIDDESMVICNACFLQHRTDNLMACQPAAIKKRDDKKHYTSPAKRAKSSK